METSTTRQAMSDATDDRVRKKKRILKSVEYASICSFIKHYHGLAIDCEMEMVKSVFPDVERLTLKSILQTELSTRMRAQHWQYEENANKYLQT